MKTPPRLIQKRKLSLVTYEFPYGTRETFLENEIGILAENFETVTLIPARAAYSPRWRSHASSSSKRSTPDNVVIQLPEPLDFSKVLYATYFFFRVLMHANIHVSGVRTMWTQLRSLLMETLKSALFVVTTLKQFKHNSNSIVYTYWKDPGAIACCLFWIHGIIEFKPVIRCHRADLYYDIPGQPFRSYDRMVSRIAYAVVPISEHGRAHLLSNGFEPRNVVVSHLGVSIPDEMNPGSTDGQWRILSCSNIIPVKRVTNLAKAISKIEKPTVWTHIGSGVELAAVKSLAERFPPHITTQFPGQMSNSQVVEFLRTCPVDLFVNFSSSEGIPVSIMEAMSFGIPCIATDVGGTGEIVDDNCGRLVGFDCSEDELATTIEFELSQPAIISQKRHYARIKIADKFSNTRNYNEFTKLLLKQYLEN